MSNFSFWKSMWPPLRSGKIDDVVFKLYYRYTVLILLVFSFVITFKLLFGNSFSCISNDDMIHEATAYCYSHGPYIVESAGSKKVGKEIPHPFVKVPTRSDDKTEHVPYYQWVNLFLLMLAVFFYLPHLLWKCCEGGLMTRLTSKVNDTRVNECERKAATVEIAKYIVVTRGGHLLYAGACLLSELLNWITAVVLTVSLVKFFNVSFSSTEFEMETWDDFFLYNFPRVALCDFYRYGASGSVQKHIFMCFLYLNNFYGYMFLFLFVWFIMLCVIGALNLPIRIFGLLIPPIRILQLRISSGLTDQALLNFVNTQFSVGDWFLLMMLQKNLLPHDLTRLLIYVQQNFNKSCYDMEMDDLSKLG